MSSWLDVAIEAFVTQTIHRRPGATFAELSDELKAYLAQVMSRLEVRGIITPQGTMPVRYYVGSTRSTRVRRRDTGEEETPATPTLTPAVTKHRRRASRKGAETWLGHPCAKCGDVLTLVNTNASQRAHNRICKSCMAKVVKASKIKRKTKGKVLAR